MSITRSSTNPVAPPQTKHVAARATAAEFDPAVQACDFAVVVWELPDGVVRVANEPAAQLFGVPLAQLPGASHADLLDTRGSITTALDVLGSGAVEVVSSERRLRPGSAHRRVRVWSRAIELDGTRAVVSLLIPTADIRGIGRDPISPWSDLSPIAIGTTDLAWSIESISSDIREIIGIDPADAAGRSMLDLVHPDDAWKLVEQREHGIVTPRSHCYVRLRHCNDGYVDVCVLIGDVQDEGAGRVAFTLIAVPHAAGAGSEPRQRVAELELRLRHIAAEVRAAGVLDDFGLQPVTTRDPRLRDLSGRQWEILDRLLRGDRVPTIAEALFLSQSTVRNHLATIYAKFDVHSQAELLSLLRKSSLSDG